MTPLFDFIPPKITWWEKILLCFVKKRYSEEKAEDETMVIISTIVYKKMFGKLYILYSYVTIERPEEGGSNE